MSEDPDDPYLELTVTEEGSTVTVRVGGDLDVDTVPELQDVLVGWADRPGGRVVLDLSELEFCDSTGLGALVGLRRRLLAAGGSLALVGVSGQVARLFSYTGLAPMFGIDAPADVDAADVSAG
ncbi:anti-sigma factor antagonist [Virgisporangium aliadipatigenens]|uniref:Anti-sigma factor antagonist n=1 Tax=Virgisporangium aliadipatigenens TaxID=741659 RepID=A0A8J4DSH4_9ACTN|nr:STAS domain-containing protein [Virgisporangium aliadipatigenens]GIJ48176.1 anti-sigma factor antagonist [Virgisporangium aliadipatigenens]